MYERISDLPASTRALPYHGKRIFRKSFNEAYERHGNEQTAFRVAWAAVHRKYEKRNGRWKARPDANEYDTTTTDTTDTSTEEDDSD